MRQKIFIVISSILTVLLVIFSVGYAEESSSITEVYNVANYQNAFTVTDNYAINQTITITNNSEIEASFDLLIFFESFTSITTNAKIGSNYYITEKTGVGKYSTTTSL